jgi:hypothetical protein
LGVCLAVFLCLLWAGSALAAITDGLISCWTLDAGSGTVAADGWGTNHGSLKAGQGGGRAPLWTTGKFGGALDFDGKSSYVDCGNNATLKPASAVSISAWVKQDAINYYGQIAGMATDTGSKESGYSVLSDNSIGGTAGYVAWISAGADADGNYMSKNTGYTLGQWNHIAMTYNGSQTKVYVNGTAATPGTSESGNIDYTYVTSFYIGVYWTPVGGQTQWWLPYKGLIDDVGVWNRALSAGEISWLYNGGTGNSILGGACVDVSEPGGSTEVQEGGAGDSYTVVLCTQPAYSVVITATPADGQITLNGAAPGAAVNLTFTTGNWNTPQTVNVAAFDDDVYEGTTPHTTTITHSSQSSDPKYNNISIRSVDVSVIDNEQICGDWGYLKADLNKDCYVDLRDFAIFASQWLQGG